MRTIFRLLNAKILVAPRRYRKGDQISRTDTSRADVLKSDAEVQAGPEDALVPAGVAELVVVSRLDAEVEPAVRSDIESDLRTRDEPVLDTLAVNAAAVDGQGRAEDPKIRREVEAGDRAAGKLVVDAMAIAVEQYIRFSFRQTKMPRKMRQSDVGDLLHMSLIPYVDIFRADAFAAEIARKVAENSKTKVVARLSALPTCVLRHVSRPA